MKKFAISALVVLGAVGAQAATVTFQYGLPITQSTTEINQTGSLGLFDSTLGNLTSAHLTLASMATFSFGATNTAAQAQDASITSTTVLSWSSSLSNLNPFLEAFSLSATSGIENYAAGEAKNFGPFNDNLSQTKSLSSILSSLETSGGGSFGLTCKSSSGLSLQGGGGNISTTQNTSAGCGASITYMYDAAVTPPNDVPEPSSLALIGLALAGLASVRLRKA